MPDLGVAVAVLAAGFLAGLVLATGIDVAGPKGALAPLAAVLCLILLRFPGVAFGLVLVLAVLAEVEPIGFIPSGAAFYDKAISSLTPPDALLLIGLAGVLLRSATDDERPRLPDPLTIPLLLLGLATVAGVVTGITSPVGVTTGDVFHRGMHVAYLFLVPLLGVNVLRDTRALKAFMAIAALLAVSKGLTGLYATLAGVGGAVEKETATFLNPLPNLLILLFVLGVVAALIRRVRIPAWMLLGAPISLLALILSYRRSFWIAAAFTLVLVVILASRRRGRAVLAVTGVALALTLVTAFTIGSSSDPSSSPIAERAQTISPSGLGVNRGDRYRMDERRNVIENIEEHPLTGIGLGVAWKVHQPLAEAHDRRYAHIAVLWYWLAFGPLGAVAYLALLASALWAAVRIWRRHPDPVVQVGAIACFGTLVGLAIVELTATFTGVEPRLSLLVGGLLAWLAAAWRDLPAKGQAKPTI